MGKGDKKTKRGKLFSGSYGKLRPRKKLVETKGPGSKAKKEAPKPAKPVKKEEVIEDAPIKEVVADTAPAEKKAAVPEVKEEKKPAAKKAAPAKKKEAAPKAEKTEDKPNPKEDTPKAKE